ncbi:MAG: HAMP domain-containing histidine kinase [Deltaproteobacteria bacterium]|nr:HAMP domain-containing histidine kinase [Deltaproteobacteria bacterium]
METAELRRQAGKRLRTERAELYPTRTEEETQRLVHELEVHQIELEMQNEELRKVREELETTLEKYTDLYDFAPVGYLTLAHDGIIRAANLTGATLLGVERSGLIGRRFGLFVSAGHRAAFSAFLGKVFASRAKETCEVELDKVGSLPFFAQIEALACTSGDECLIALIDISERRRAETALAEKQRELEELNRSLETRILRAVDELRLKDQLMILQDRRAVMGEMINNIAHQWRQPLNSLGLYIQELEFTYESGEFSGELLRNYASEAMGLIQHMSQTIDDFRGFFRSDKEKTVFGVDQVIRRTVSLVEKSFLDQGIRIAVSTEGNPTVTGYPNEYAQVLLNILTNALDELVEHDVDDARIVIRCFESDGKAIVTVADNAGGIAKEIVDRVFDPYFSTKEPDKGTGIGLFMSKIIIEKSMGGRLTFRNAGEGAEFRIEV